MVKRVGRGVDRGKGCNRRKKKTIHNKKDGAHYNNYSVQLVV